MHGPSVHGKGLHPPHMGKHHNPRVDHVHAGSKCTIIMTEATTCKQYSLWTQYIQGAVASISCSHIFYSTSEVTCSYSYIICMHMVRSSLEKAVFFERDVGLHGVYAEGNGYIYRYA